MRLDKYLKVSRLIKRRTVANDACDNERVMVNGRVQRASYDVKPGDRIAIRFGYFTTDRDGLREMVAAAQQELAPESAEPWQVYFYPDTDDVGIVEVVLDAAAQD